MQTLRLYSDKYVLLAVSTAISNRLVVTIAIHHRTSMMEEGSHRSLIGISEIDVFYPYFDKSIMVNESLYGKRISRPAEVILDDIRHAVEYNRKHKKTLPVSHDLIAELITELGFSAVGYEQWLESEKKYINNTPDIYCSAD